MLKEFFTKYHHLYTKNKVKTFFSLGLLLTIFYGVYLRWLALDSVIINEWVTRDFDRALSLLNGDHIPLAGPDLSNGGRLPGPFMYFFLLLPLWINPSYEILFDFNFLLNIISLLAVYLISKKYFGFYFAAISLALISIDLYHIGSVHFPMNPSFMILFLILFVGAYFEFSLRKNEKLFPLMVLILSLGVHFHYQIAAYSLTPILMAIIFKIKISKRSILLSLLILIICFLPYGIYKSKTFTPDIKGFQSTGYFRISSIPQEAPSFIWLLIKSVPVQETIKRLFLRQPFNINFFVQKEIRNIKRIIYSFAFYFFTFFIGIQSAKYGKENYKKEFSLFTLFYFPALIYEIITPIEIHYWYNYIFTLPKVYIVTYTLIFIIKSIHQKFIKIGISFIFFICFIYLSFYSQKITFIALNYFNNNLQNINNLNSIFSGSYKNSKLLLNTLMNHLQLNPKEYYERVYFLDFDPSSFRRIQLAKKILIHQRGVIRKTRPEECFFILDRRSMAKFANSPDRIEASKPKVFYAFLKDPTITIEDSQEVFFTKFGFAKSFFIYKYRPKYKQPCYSNGHNFFTVSEDIRSLLHEAKVLTVSTKTPKTMFSQVSSEEKYGSNSELLFWEGKYIILNPTNITPFRLTITIEKRDHSYSVRGAIDSFFYYDTGHANFSFLDILFTLTKSNKPIIKSKVSIIDSFKARIFSKNSLLTTNGLNDSGFGLRNYNKNWHREYLWNPKIKLKKNNFYINVVWAMYRHQNTFEYKLELKNLSIQNPGYPPKNLD